MHTQYMPIPTDTYSFLYLAVSMSTGKPVLMSTCQYIPSGYLQHNTVTSQTLQAQHIRNVCNITNPKLSKTCATQHIPNLNTYQYSDIRAPVQIIANPRIIGQHWTRPGTSWPRSGLTQVAYASLSARSDSESLGPARIWATINSNSPALGRTRLSQACSGPYMTCPCLLRSHRAAGQQHST